MTYKLFIDDVRMPPEFGWVLARSVNEAKATIYFRGHPELMSLDHDLGINTDGVEETVMDFLKWYAQEYYEAGPPKFLVHSSNPVGRQNMVSFLDSWSKSLLKE